MQQSVPLTDTEARYVPEILKRYGIEKASVVRSTVGYDNTTFIVESAANKFVLRRSKEDISLEHLQLEIALLRYLHEQRFSLSPQVLPNLEGEYLIRENGFFTLQNFMPGEIRASWNYGLEEFKGKIFRNYCRASARFTRAVEGFEQPAKYGNRPLARLLAEACDQLSGEINALPDSPARDIAEACSESLLIFGESARESMNRSRYDELPKQVVHLDLHPGNFHFQNDEVTAVFDYDWVQFDSRISDIAATLGQSCYPTAGERVGTIDADKFREGLAAYREAYGRSELSITEENQCIAIALKAYLFYLAVWTVRWCRENSGSEQQLSVMRLARNVCLENDFDGLLRQ